MTRLSLQQVSFSHGTVPVLREIDLTLETGEIVAIVGPNGAGKSTLLQLAAGLLEPASGSVLLEGQPLAGLARRGVARHVAGMLDAGATSSPLTVREVVGLGRHPWRGAFAASSADDVARVEDALARFDLASLAGRPVRALSSGEWARVELARCLCQDAPLWLLDEPTAHLDLGHVHHVLRLLRQESAQGCRGVLIVLHDLNQARLVADRVVLLSGGTALATGPAADVLTPAHVERAFGARVVLLDVPGGTPLLAPAPGGGSA
jgi:iron complex transport system ATP-binding protein